MYFVSSILAIVPLIKARRVQYYTFAVYLEDYICSVHFLSN